MKRILSDRKKRDFNKIKLQFYRENFLTGINCFKFQVLQYDKNKKRKEGGEG